MPAGLDPDSRACGQTGRERILRVTAAVTDTEIADKRPCVRCSRLALLSVVGRCPDCVAEMGLRHPDEYEQWKAEVQAEYGRK
jgi:hypothetical protein